MDKYWWLDRQNRSQVWPCLTTSTAILFQTILISCVDYRNSLVTDIPVFTVDPRRSVLNTATSDPGDPTWSCWKLSQITSLLHSEYPRGSHLVQRKSKVLPGSLEVPPSLSLCPPLSPAYPVQSHLSVSQSRLVALNFFFPLSFLGVSIPHTPSSFWSLLPCYFSVILLW